MSTRRDFITKTAMASAAVVAAPLVSFAGLTESLPDEKSGTDNGKDNIPFVRIDLVAGRSDEELKVLADSIHEVLAATFAAPASIRNQIIHEHRPGLIKALDTGLGYERTDKIVILQIAQQGRSTEQKQAMYAAMSKRLEANGIPPTDLIISVVEF